MAELERRIRELESAQNDGQGQVSPIPQFVPIPQLQNVDEKLPWTFDADTGKWLRPFVNLPVGRHAVESADGIAGRNYVKIAFSGDPVVETDTIVSSDETNIDEDIYCFYVGTLAEDPNDQGKLTQTEGVYSEPVLMVYV